MSHPDPLHDHENEREDDIIHSYGSDQHQGRRAAA